MTKIFVVDDDPITRTMLQAALTSHDYEVRTAANGEEAIPAILRYRPDLVLTDVNMPKLDGIGLCRALRADARTTFTPIIFLSARAAVEDKLTGFDVGADDYVTKPVSLPELFARINVQLRKVAERGIVNSLSHLPGGTMIEAFLQMLLKQPNLNYAILYIDLDNFKAYNDYYGFARGNQVIILVADILRDVLGAEPGLLDFLGHVGGDDFIMVVNYERAEEICQLIIAEFDRRIILLYDDDDLNRGYITANSRLGALRNFGLVSISIGVVSNRSRQLTSLFEISDISAEVKHAAKQIPGSSYYFDKRRG